jgi:hypothetical protein
MRRVLPDQVEIVVGCKLLHSPVAVGRDSELIAIEEKRFD